MNLELLGGFGGSCGGGGGAMTSIVGLCFWMGAATVGWSREGEGQN